MRKFAIILLGILLSVNGAFATRYVTTTTYPSNPAYNPSIYNNPYRAYQRPVRTDYGRHPRPIYDRPYDNPRYQNRYDANYTQTQTTRVGGLLNSISNMFMGTPTGMTPQVNPYWDGDFYAPNGKQTDYVGRNGWIHTNNQIGSDTGVHIID